MRIVIYLASYHLIKTPKKRSIFDSLLWMFFVDFGRGVHIFPQDWVQLGGRFLHVKFTGLPWFSYLKKNNDHPPGAKCGRFLHLPSTPHRFFFGHILKFKYDNFFKIIVILQIVIFPYFQNNCHITYYHISKKFQKIVILRLS